MRKVFLIAMLFISTTIFAQNSLYKITNTGNPDEFNSYIGKKICFYQPMTDFEYKLSVWGKELHVPYILKDIIWEYDNKRPMNFVFCDADKPNKTFTIKCSEKDADIIPMYLYEEYRAYFNDYINTNVNINSDTYVLKRIEWNEEINFEHNIVHNIPIYVYESQRSKRTLRTTLNFKYLQDKYNFTIEEESGITFSKVFNSDSLSKEQLYNLMESYFTYFYGKGDWVIQVKSSDDGYILGKGVYANVFSEIIRWFNLKLELKVNYPHIIRMDCKDKKVRVAITVSQYEDGDVIQKIDTYSYPFSYQKNNGKLNKTEKEYAARMASLVLSVENHFKSIEKVIKDRENIPIEQNW